MTARYSSLVCTADRSNGSWSNSPRVIIDHTAMIRKFVSRLNVTHCLGLFHGCLAFRSVHDRAMNNQRCDDNSLNIYWHECWCSGNSKQKMFLGVVMPEQEWWASWKGPSIFFLYKLLLICKGCQNEQTVGIHEILLQSEFRYMTRFCVCPRLNRVSDSGNVCEIPARFFIYIHDSFTSIVDELFFCYN